MIRLARLEDFTAVEAIVRDAYSIYLGRMDKPPGPMLDDYAVLIRDGSVSVVDENGGVLAIIVLLAKSDHLLLDNVAVTDSEQGRGHGRALIAFAEQEAIRRGQRTLRLFGPRLEQVGRAAPMMAAAVSTLLAGVQQIVLVGRDSERRALARVVARKYLPFAITIEGRDQHRDQRSNRQLHAVS